MPTYRITVNGNLYEVEIADPFASPVVATVNGERYMLAVEELPVAAPEEDMEASPRPLPERPPVPTVTPDPAPKVEIETAGIVVATPMPGKVLAVNVCLGQSVCKGDEVCTLEAMKMAMAVRATADGVVREVKVSAGQTVRHGEALLVLG
ncbi:MAG: biotin/lipoyl-containing protein [Chloroflexota bacterium]